MRGRQRLGGGLLSATSPRRGHPGRLRDRNRGAERCDSGHVGGLRTEAAPGVPCRQLLHRAPVVDVVLFADRQDVHELHLGARHYPLAVAARSHRFDPLDPLELARSHRVGQKWNDDCAPTCYRGMFLPTARQPDGSQDHAPRLGPGRDRRQPRADGRRRQTKRTARDRLDGRDQTAPTPDRLPADHATDRTRLADARRRSDIGAPLAVDPTRGQTLHPFRAAIEARDVDAAVALLSTDVVFRSPVVSSPTTAVTPCG